jgi:hypothetical protein
MPPDSLDQVLKSLLAAVSARLAALRPQASGDPHIRNLIYIKATFSIGVRLLKEPVFGLCRNPIPTTSAYPGGKKS